jgi:hypothetical protein
MMLPVDKFQHNESLCGDCDADPAIMQRKQLRGLSLPAARNCLICSLPGVAGLPIASNVCPASAHADTG